METPHEHAGELAIDLANTLERRRVGAGGLGAELLQALRGHVLDTCRALRLPGTVMRPVRINAPGSTRPVARSGTAC
jgi:hypothetical protein